MTTIPGEIEVIQSVAAALQFIGSDHPIEVSAFPAMVAVDAQGDDVHRPTPLAWRERIAEQGPMQFA